MNSLKQVSHHVRIGCPKQLLNDAVFILLTDLCLQADSVVV